MSHDGCVEVTWKGQAFPYLMHHPNSFLKTENYGSARSQGHGSSGGHGYGSHAPLPSQQDGSDVHSRAGTGTWNGPAPRSMQRAGQPEPVAAPVREPDSVRLSNGDRMPLVGYGTAAIKSAQCVKDALAQGYRHIDCAWVYDTEHMVGEALKEWVDGGRRSELYIVSKVWQTHHRPEAVRKGVEESLAKLGCGHLDLLLMHWPEAWTPGSTNESNTPDNEVTIAQTWAAMEALVDEGKVRALGVSNFSLKQVEELLAGCRIKPLVNQIELHPFLPQRKLVGVCYRHGVQCVAYSPLGGQNFFVANDLLTNPTVAAVAKEVGKTPAQVLLKWNTQRGVPVIPKASSVERLKENADLFSWRLPYEAKAALDALECGKRFITFPWKQWADPEEGGVAKPSLVMGL